MELTKNKLKLFLAIMVRKKLDILKPTMAKKVKLRQENLNLRNY